MASHRMQGQELYDSNHRKIGEIRGSEILDANWRRIGEVRNNEILDATGRRVADIHGDDILDENRWKIGTLPQAREAIDGAAGGTSVAALWYFFIR